MTRSDRALALAATRERDHAEAPPAVAPPAPERNTPVRQTFDLPPALHRRLRRKRQQIGLDLDREDLTVQQLLLAMVEVLVDDGDPTVERRVRARIEQTLPGRPPLQ